MCEIKRGRLDTCLVKGHYKLVWYMCERKLDLLDKGLLLL